MLSLKKYIVAFVALLSVYARVRATANDESFTSVNYQEEVSLDHIGSHGHMQHEPPLSCRQMKKNDPTTRSGTHYVMFRGEYIPVHCNMDVLCDSDDGWTRIVYINAQQSCPSGFTLYTSGNTKACGRRSGARDGSCDSTTFSSMGIKYSQVCGFVYAYQYNSPDAYAIHAGKTNIQTRIDSAYIDGVSITHGTPRKHIWSLMAAQSEKVTRHTKNYVCPCTAGNAQPKLPSFIGYHTTDPLWDGKNCRNNEVNCCKAGMPWFYKNLGYTTNDDIELRICGDQSQTDEDARVFSGEIYVK
ncbi:PREDICTED: uncharacterized protein LOC109580623 [Amphimedon queenslandica]|uniref:Uncharacterized protein n=1 Tax=Amphimedon queenslandica TaxID=400682 RepID=A0AAN0IXT5_AMPQE|nr:PREDICTED: uncharacterized protein LOC109580623 [Amphimedon queenslandica]|eukprot:XP_019849580.1 PREDICTED: uncharacterized protein LOC109580623 [Amphimedon queenslandica]